MLSPKACSWSLEEPLKNIDYFKNMAGKKVFHIKV